MAPIKSDAHAGLLASHLNQVLNTRSKRRADVIRHFSVTGSAVCRATREKEAQLAITPRNRREQDGGLHPPYACRYPACRPRRAWRFRQTRSRPGPRRQRGDGVADIRNATLCFGHSLGAADGSPRAQSGSLPRRAPDAAAMMPLGPAPVARFCREPQAHCPKRKLGPPRFPTASN
jgi:hypothetical protein